MIDLNPLWLTAKLAFYTTSILLLISVPLSYLLAYGKFPGRSVFEVLVSLPMVLPPSVLGFYLLVAFSPNHFFGKILSEYLNIQLLFSFGGLIIASVLYSLPYMVNPLLSGFRSLPHSLQEASYTLGKSRWVTLFRVLLPNMRPAILVGIVMSFAHSIGEFGVVMMVGGSIPKETKVVSIAIFDEVQAMNYDHAYIYSGILFVSTFLILLLVYRLNNKQRKEGGGS